METAEFGLDESRLQSLRRLAEQLEPDALQRKMLLKQVQAYVERYLENLPKAPTFVASSGPPPVASLSEQDDSIDHLLDEFERWVNQPGLKPGAPGYLAFIPGGGLFVSALADFLAAITNKYAGIYFAAPGAVTLERQVVRWLADVVGYPESAEGDLTSGGSLAHLAAIVTAREATGLKSQDIPRSVIYLTEQTHHSVAKAVRIAGLAESIIRRVPLDDFFRMRVDRLAEQLVSDRREGLRPFLVVASAGTTDSGAVDPLAKIAEVCQKEQIWLHVDAAYGGAFALCEEGRMLLAGLADADSLILDPHKGLFVPFGTGAVLVKQGELLRHAHEYHASYLINEERLAQNPPPSPAELSAELSRHFRALRLWLPLKLHGIAPFRAALEEKLLLARYAYRKLKEIPGFEVGPPPDLTIFTFRYHPRRGDLNEFNRRLLTAIQSDGQVFLSSTVIDGRFTLRLAVLGFRTHREHVDLALDLLQKKAKELEEL